VRILSSAVIELTLDLQGDFEAEDEIEEALRVGPGFIAPPVEPDLIPAAE